MNAGFKLFLSMSLSGGLLILILIFGKRFLKDKISRQWQYYIWLAAILRLLLPFGTDVNLLGRAYQAVDQAMTRNASFPPQQQSPPNDSGSIFAPAVEAKPGNEDENNAATAAATTAYPFQNMVGMLLNYIWLVWLVVALGLLIRKVTIYQSFIRYIRAGLTPVFDVEMLDRLSIAAEQMAIKKPVELCVNPLVSSPLLIGFFHPCIVLPRPDIPEKDFQCTVLHELTHDKRRDLLYKWLVQITVCLHWFNPLVHLMSREITKACEFSCDEAVLTKMGSGSAQDYGKTLLNAMVAVGRYRENFGVVTLSENKQLLKERLSTIMNFRKKSTAIRFLTGALTLCVVFGAAFIGVYPIDAAAKHTNGRPQTGANKVLTREKTGINGDRYSQAAEKYYEAGSLPLFQIAFGNLDAEAQSKWLERIFADRRLTFFGAAVNLLDEDCTQIQQLAETIYKDGDVAFFSMLTIHMSEETLEAWLDRALADENWTFQSILFNSLDRDIDEQKEKHEKEWVEAQTAEYGAVGVTMDGKDYYYQGKLVNVFLDIRPNKSFYTLNMNPKGTVNIKIVRNENNEITGVAYMTESEVTELLGGMEDPDDQTEVETIPIDLKNVASGETIFLGEYTLSAGDRICYDVSAETGTGMQIFFAQDKRKNTVYWSVHNLRQSGESLECSADFTVEPPAKPGTYKLFLRAADGALGNVRGNISITFIDEAD